MSVIPNISCPVERDIITKLSSLNAKAYAALGELKKAQSEAIVITGAQAMADAYAKKVIPAMNELRRYVDEMETLTSTECWPLPSYGDMMLKV